MIFLIFESDLLDQGGSRRIKEGIEMSHRPDGVKREVLGIAIKNKPNQPLRELASEERPSFHL